MQVLLRYARRATAFKPRVQFFRPRRTFRRRDVSTISKLPAYWYIAPQKRHEPLVRGERVKTNAGIYYLPKSLPPKTNQSVTDKRYWYPYDDRPILTKEGAVASLGKDLEKVYYYTKALPRSIKYYAQKPRRLVECIKRKMRKEVIHAKGIAGSVGQRRPRWKRESYIIC